MIKKLQEIKNQKSVIKDILKEFKQSFIYVGIASMLINILMLVPSLYMLQVYDRVLASRSQYTLLMITLITVFLFLIIASLEIVRSRILVRVGNRLDAKLSSDIFRLMFVAANKNNFKVSSLPLTDLTVVRQFLTGAPVFAILDAPWMPIYLAVLFIFDFWFGVFGVASVIVIAILMFVNEKKTKEPIHVSNLAFQDSSQYVNSSLRNSEVIEAMGMLSNIKHKWFEKYGRFLFLQSNASDEAGVWANASKSYRIISQSLILGLGALLVINNDLTAGMMIAGSIILGRAIAPLDLLTGTWKQFINARESFFRLESLLANADDLVEPTRLPDPIGKITLEGVVVAPPNSKNPTLKSVSMDIEPGELVAVIGPSAAGKSTLARTILGVWKPMMGSVRIDMAELSQWNKDNLGKFLGYLPQDVELFEGTIADNIARFNEPNPEKIVEAAKIAGVHEMILKLENGYDTEIGVGGATLSGGQRQRIGLARALYDMPKVVVLDEPNSNLDDVGEQALVNAIMTLKENGSTIILVTHRPSILSIVDKIALLVDGSLQMYGNRDEVLQRLSNKHQAVNKAS